MPSLTVVAGPNEGDYYVLGKRTLVVGRDQVCSIQVLDELISRKHLQVRFEPDAKRYHILDMRSANGVYVNGRKIEAETELADGDVIQIGNSRLAYAEQEFPDRSTAMSHHKQLERSKPTLFEG